MTDKNADRAAASWDTYWRGTGDIGAFSSGGVNHPAISHYWSDTFSKLAASGEVRRMLDVATGNGTLLDAALLAFASKPPELSCVDISAAAIKTALERHKGLHGLVADAREIPLPDRSFDLVTSQFGVEYAGLDAILESARLVDDGGQLRLMLHNADSSIYTECSDNLDALRKFQDANFVALSLEFFKHGFAAVRGSDRAPYDRAGARLAPAIQAAEAIMREYGEDVAGGTIAQLYADVGQIHSKLPNYDPEQVLQWLMTMRAELESFTERMASMTDAAISSEAFEATCNKLTDAGLTVNRNSPLVLSDSPRPLAWVLEASR